jgi:hypothetical protein
VADHGDDYLDGGLAEVIAALAPIRPSTMCDD